MQELGGTEVAYAREDDFVGFTHIVGRLSDVAVRAEVPQRFDHAGEIARFIVNDLNHGKAASLQVNESTSQRTRRLARVFSPHDLAGTNTLG